MLAQTKDNALLVIKKALRRRKAKLKIELRKQHSRKILQKAVKDSVHPEQHVLRFIGMQFAVSQGDNAFGAMLPPKWGKVVSFNGFGEWKIQYSMTGISASGTHGVPKTQTKILTTADFTRLVKETGMDHFLRQDSAAHEKNQSDSQDAVMLDTVVVRKVKRQFVGTQLTLPYTKKKKEKTNRKYRFAMISDYRVCPVKHVPGGKRREKEVWMILFDDHSQIFCFRKNMELLIADKVEYDIAANEYSVKNIMHCIVEHWLFETIILLLIAMNCFTMIVSAEMDECGDDDDYCEERDQTTFEAFEAFFTIAFTIEMVCKMIGLGFFADKPPGYFRDTWNYLDFFIVMEGIVSMFVPSNVDLSGIRLMRILRPLRAVTHLPGLKRIVDALIRSLPMLADTMVICFFYFIIFGICALQIWMGMFRTHCFYEDTGMLVTGTDEEGFTCGGGYMCKTGEYCGYNVMNPNQGVTSFDNVLVSMLTIFQSITLEGWCEIMYWGMDSSSIWTWIYFFFLIMFGSFILINLTLAVILSKFNEGQANVVREEARLALLADDARAERNREARALYFGYDPDEDKESKDADGKNGVDDPRQKTLEDLKHGEAQLGAMGPSKQSDMTDIDLGDTKSGMADEGSDDEGGAAAVAPEGTDAAIAEGPQEVPTSCLIWATEDEDYRVTAPAFTLIRVPLVGKWCDSMVFEIAMCVLIVTNMIVLALDHYPQSESFEDGLKTTNLIFTFLFIGEMIFKLVGLGLWGYFYDPLNQVDFFIIMMGVLEITVMGSSAFTAFRAVRFMRLVKLVRFMKSMQDILKILAKSAASIFYIAILLSLFLLIYSILGMQLFKHKLKDAEGNVPRNNYDSFHWAFICVFQVLAGENWPALMFDGVNGTDWGTAVIFYITWVVLGQFILLNLFLAVVMSNFDELGLEEEEEEEEEEGALTEAEKNKAKFDGSRHHIDPERLLHLDTSTHERNIYCIAVGGPCHLKILDVVCSAKFRNGILFLILLSSLALALECPATVDPDHEENTYDDDQDDIWISALSAMEIIFVILFSLEVMLKSMAMGFIMHTNAYLRNGWNLIDFAVVVSALFDQCVGVDAVSWMRILRLVRVLRPLRVIQRNPGLRRVVNSLILSMGALKDILLVLCFVWAIFSLLGVQLFKGRLFMCTDPDFPSGMSKFGECALAEDGECMTGPGGAVVYSTPPCDGNVTEYYQVEDSTTNSSYYLANNTDGDGEPREWFNSDMNFDNVWEAFLVLFVSASGEGWPDVMFATCDIIGIDKQPELNAAPYYAYYWVIYVSLVCFFFAELFVGAVFEKFCELKRTAAKTGSAVFLTEHQQRWVKHQKDIMKVKPIKPKGCILLFPETVKHIEMGRVSRNDTWSKIVLLLNACRKRCFILCSSEYFTSVIMFFILLNTLTMAMPYYQMGEHMEFFLHLSNYIFTFVFVIEMFVKIFALTFRGYLSDNWNCFDFFVVMGSILDLVITSFNASIFRVLRIGRAIAKLLRLVRVMRVVRLAKAMEGLQKVMATLWLSIPAMMNIGALLLLLFFIFAVLGTFLFGDLALEKPHSSFIDFPNAMLTLFRVSTGEDWQNLMYGCYDGEYGEFTAAIYFVVFVFAAAFIILNLFVMIIAENFEVDAPEEELPEDADFGVSAKEDKEDQMEMIDEQTTLLRKSLRVAWSRLDPEATAFIHKDQLRALLIDIGPPAGIRGDASLHIYEKLVLQLQLTKLGDFLNFTDVFKSLHKVLLSHISGDISNEIISAVGLDSAAHHSTIREITMKRTKKATSDAKKKILTMIADGSSPDLHFGSIKNDFTIEILLCKLQRRWREKLAARKKARNKKMAIASRRNTSTDSRKKGGRTSNLLKNLASSTSFGGGIELEVVRAGSPEKKGTGTSSK